MRDIEFIRIHHLKGPNIWTYRPVIEAWVDIGELEDFPSNIIPGFYERLSAWLPTLEEHRCSYGEKGGFLRRLREGTWPAHILEHVTLELQGLSGFAGGFGKAREASRRGVYKVVVRAHQPELTLACLHAAKDLVLAAMEDRTFDLPSTLDRLKRIADKHCLGPSTAAIVDAADDRDIPFMRLNEGNLVQLGYGARSRRIWTAETDATSAIAEGISRDKSLTKKLLANCGVPVPEGTLVDSAAEAWEAAQDIGLPVVIKPTDGNHGRGVFVGLATREAIETAFEVANGEGSGVIVERSITGTEHRLLVVGGKMVAAARGEEAIIEGDGISDISTLIETQINSSPLRGSTEEHPLNVVRLDTAARLELERQGYSPESVPGKGAKVLIQRSGSVCIDVTDLVHPENAAIVALAARIVGLDIAGIDLVAEDISKPLKEQHGAIVEVNAGPGLLMHLKPARGKPRPVGRAIVDSLFNEGESGRIPVVGVTGTGNNADVAMKLSGLLQMGGFNVGLACSEGLYIGRRRIPGEGSWTGSRKMLLNRNVDAAVFENGPRAILEEGLVYDRCQVGIVTGVAGSKIEEFEVRDDEKMANVVRTQVDVVLPGGAAVLNADDELVSEMAKYCDGEAILYASEPGAVVRHVEAGGRAVFLRGRYVFLAQEKTEKRLMEGDRGMLPVIAAAIALGLDVGLIKEGMASFEFEEKRSRQCR